MVLNLILGHAQDRTAVITGVVSPVVAALARQINSQRHGNAGAKGTICWSSFVQQEVANSVLEKGYSYPLPSSGITYLNHLCTVAALDLSDCSMRQAD